MGLEQTRQRAGGIENSVTVDLKEFWRYSGRWKSTGAHWDGPDALVYGDGCVRDGPHRTYDIKDR